MSAQNGPMGGAREPKHDVILSGARSAESKDAVRSQPETLQPDGRAGSFDSASFGRSAQDDSVQVFNPADLRIGQGYDVHALAEGRKLMLGGVDVPHGRGLLGHSDADVLAHAVADALLGGIRGGDIGKLFPDTDPAYRGIDSLKLLSAVAEKVREAGYDILDVDSVVAAQAPKLAPYRDAMRENLARAMGISPDNVGVKATTTEWLGFEGREEGISATAVCLLCRCRSRLRLGRDDGHDARA